MLELSGLLVCLGRTCSVFLVPRGTEEIAELWFARGAQYSEWHYAKFDHFKYSKISKFSLSTMVANSKPSSEKCIATALKLVALNWWLSGPIKIIEIRPLLVSSISLLLEAADLS